MMPDATDKQDDNQARGSNFYSCCVHCTTPSSPIECIWGGGHRYRCYSCKPTRRTTATERPGGDAK